jgi:large subunit ribosomal protein L25
MELTAYTREIRGKKVKTLRAQGITPAHVFGHGIEPMPVQCDTSELRRTLAKAGTTGIISLKIEQDKTPRNVMVREIQREPRTHDLLHVDFYQIRMEEKLKVEIPLVLVGEAPALKMKENYLAHEMNIVTVECLPDAIPSHIDVDISSLAEAEDSIFVSDIVPGKGVTVLNHPEQLIAKISVRHAEKEEAPVEAAPEAADEKETPEE